MVKVVTDGSRTGPWFGINCQLDKEVLGPFSPPMVQFCGGYPHSSGMETEQNSKGVNGPKLTVMKILVLSFGCVSHSSALSYRFVKSEVLP